MLATTALAFSAGFAAAEVSFSGQAKMGLKYDNGATETEKTRAHSEAVLYVAMSGETDTGLAFGATIDMIVENNDGVISNDDTTVFISGAFGKLSMGAVPEADENGGISDIGWDDLNTDDIAENLSGDELDDYAGVPDLDHNVNYTYAADAFSVSVSGRIGDAVVDSYAVGGRYNFGDAYVGLGYAKHSFDDFDADAKVMTAVAGGTFGAFGVAAMYSDGEIEIGSESTDVDAFGVRASYSMDAWTFVAAYSESDTGAFGDFVDADADGLSDQKGYGLAASYDLGGGASLAGGVAKIDSGDGEKDTVADFGVTMSF